MVSASAQLAKTVPQLTRCGVRGWVFLPAIILFLQQESVWAVFVAVVAAALVAVCRFTGTIPYGEHEIPRSQQYLEKSLFTTQVRLAPTYGFRSDCLSVSMERSYPPWQGRSYL